MLPLFTLEEYLLAHEHKAELSFCSSGVDSLTLKTLLALADPDSLRRWETLQLGYSTPQGAPLLRAEIANQYANLPADGVMLFSGACEAIFCAMQALLTPSDHAVVITPCYQSLKSVAASICPVTEVPLRFEDNWQLDVSSIEAAMRPDTHMIIVNFPNNPTGAIPDLQTFQALVELARRHNAYLFSDEVYQLMELDPADRLPAAVDCYEKGLSVGSLSKVYGLPGLRVGWLATRDTSVISKLLSFRHYATICENTPGETLALMALRARNAIVANHMAQLRTQFQQFQVWMTAHADTFEWVPPKAGCLAFPRLRQGSADRFAMELLTQEKVLLLPGSLYETPGEFLRFGFGNQNLPESLHRLERFLAASSISRQPDESQSQTGCR